MNPLSSPAKNRRLAVRRAVKRCLKVACRKGVLGLGPDLGNGVLDLSETGIRLLVTAPLDKGQEIELILGAPWHPCPIKLPAEVVWTAPAADGSCGVGARFRQRLSYAEFSQLTG